MADNTGSSGDNREFCGADVKDREMAKPPVGARGVSLVRLAAITGYTATNAITPINIANKPMLNK
jgi:hypothetical protein